MKVLLHGATGTTGTLVARALRGRGVAPVLVGRNPAKLAALAADLGGDVETRAVEVSHIEALYDATDDADIIVNCAGPFSTLGEPVIRAALRAGAHYLDTTGEQAFMREMYERYESAARKADVCIVSGFAFEVALGDMCAALAAAPLAPTRNRPVDEVAVGYAINDFAPTRGTALSALVSMAGPGVAWQHERWDPVPPGADRRAFAFPAPFGSRTGVSFPSGEVITVPRHIHARRVQTYLSMSGALGALAGRLSPVVGPAVRAVMGSPLRKVLERAVAARPEAPTDGQRAIADFCVAAVARRGDDAHMATASGTDVYGVTADIVGLGVDLLVQGAHRRAGVLAPAEAFDAAATLDAMPVSATVSGL